MYQPTEDRFLLFPVLLRYPIPVKADLTDRERLPHMTFYPLDGLPWIPVFSLIGILLAICPHRPQDRIDRIIAEGGTHERLRLGQFSDGLVIGRV